jgi:hypothetical protein
MAAMAVNLLQAALPVVMGVLMAAAAVAHLLTIREQQRVVQEQQVPVSLLM